MPPRSVFITGGTGYIGRGLIPRLLEEGHRVRALVRPGSEQKLAAGCEAVIGNALDESTFADQVRPSDTFVQLVGVPHPSPSKAAQFRSIDLASVRASVAAAVKAGVQHFIYVSVAQPAPVMKAYQSVRAEGEEMIRDSGLNATILRPWYVLGPGHRWPYTLIPMYRLLERLPPTRETARRLGLVTRDEMIEALARAVETPSLGIQVKDVSSIRLAAKSAPGARLRSTT
ncbi:MAG TPA: NAD(P)H-binding protein [Blastocatellia bacterium]|nr:NAD(P)H-binding protein [Blastocatellia bacterium]